MPYELMVGAAMIGAPQPGKGYADIVAYGQGSSRA